MLGTPRAGPGLCGRDPNGPGRSRTADLWPMRKEATDMVGEVAGTSQARPNWYPDPTGRHQYPLLGRLTMDGVRG